MAQQCLIVMLYVMYVHEGCSDYVGYPWRGKLECLKSFKHPWRNKGDGLKSLTIHGQCIDDAYVSYFILHGNSINIVSKYS